MWNRDDVKSVAKEGNGDEVRSSATTFFAGICAAAVIGAGVGLLFAPGPGYKLRRQLSRSVTKAADAATSTMEDLTERGAEAYGPAREVVTRANDGISRAATRAAKQLDKGLAVANDLAAAGSGPA